MSKSALDFVDLVADLSACSLVQAVSELILGFVDVVLDLSACSLIQAVSRPIRDFVYLACSVGIVSSASRPKARLRHRCTS